MADNPGLLPFLGVFGDLLDSGINYQVQKELANDEWQRQLEAMGMQREWDLQQWNRQNEYNSPASQMERFKAAGLNPNLMYSQGSSGIASSAPTSSVPRAERARIGNMVTFQNMFGVLKDSLALDSDLAVKDAQVQMLSEQADYYKELASGSSLDNVKRGVDAIFYGNVLDQLTGIKDKDGNYTTPPIFDAATILNLRSTLRGYIRNLWQGLEADYATSQSKVKAYNRYGYPDPLPMQRLTEGVFQNTGHLGNPLLQGALNLGLTLFPFGKAGKAGKWIYKRLKNFNK